MFVKLGEIYVPDDLVKAVYKHKKNMLSGQYDEEIVNRIKEMPFKYFFVDFLCKNYYSMIKNIEKGVF